MNKMKTNLIILVTLVVALVSCTTTTTKSVDTLQSEQTEQAMQQAAKEVGMPSVLNFQEKKNLKWIYELCDQENFICHAYLFNAMTGEVGQYLGKCVGYGIPYSTQFSNPNKNLKDGGYNGQSNTVLPQSEPNGLFKPEGLSATWLIMLDPTDGTLRPVYVEPEIIVSPFKLY